MKKIGWIEISKKKYGGVIYNEQARKALEPFFDVEEIMLESKIFKNIRYLKIPESLFYIWRLKKEKDLWIRDFYSSIFIKRKSLVMIHHLDFSGFPPVSRPAFYILQKIFLKKLEKADCIVTVSDYWQKYFLGLGFKNVYKIYNGFDLNEFGIKDQEAEEFKKSISSRPIIYLGNCQKAKGVVESYKALKCLDVQLVTSGRRQVNLPVLNLELDHKNYLKLLKASSIVISMSKFKEGWCRTAHEAMLSKTPVIGSGLGGMKELLEGGSQIVCPDFSELKNKAEYLLQNPERRKEIAEKGFEFAKKFTLDKFSEEWIKLIKNITQ